MDPITLIIIVTCSLAFGALSGTLLGRRSRKYREREQLRQIEDEDRRRQEREYDKAGEEAKRRETEARESVEKGARDQERERIAKSTRAALDFGYTMQQVLDWAYYEVYYKDHVPAERKQKKEYYREGGYNREKMVFAETQEEAEARVKQERYEHLRLSLLGQKDSFTMKGRDILDAMLGSGIKTSLQIFHAISEEALIESLTAGGVSDSQIMNVADILMELGEEGEEGGEKEARKRAFVEAMEESPGEHEAEMEA
jgi:hypothetical protein